MAIEVPVRKEIASFESRPAFGMTARQLVCFGAALPLGIGSYVLFSRLMSTNAASTITIFILLPIFAFGLFKKDGYTLEKYLRIVWAHRFTSQKHFYKTENATALYMSKSEWDNDLAKKMLAYSDAKTSAERETNITYHQTQKQERKIILAAKKDCVAEANQYRKLCRAKVRQNKKEIARLHRGYKRTWGRIIKGRKDEIPRLTGHGNMKNANLLVLGVSGPGKAFKGKDESKVVSHEQQQP